MIFDTDMGNDCDDALALAMIHAFEQRNEAKLLAVTVTKGHPLAAAFCERINAFYGRPAIPVGLLKDGPTPELENKMLSGEGLAAKASYPDATDLLLKTLADQPDGSVVIIQVGFSTNLARLLARPGGRELARRKVRMVSAMAGAFPRGEKEYNVYTDIAAARRVFAEWPTPIVFSGFEIGLALEYPAESIAKDFAHAPGNPIVEAYKQFQAFPHDRPTWDLTSVLYAIRPERGYFGLSEAGEVGVLPDGRTSWKPTKGAQRRHLTLAPGAKARAREALTMLVSQPR